MRSSRAAWAVLFLSLIPALLSAQTVQHDRAFWQTIAHNHYAVPDNQSAAALAQELSQLFASPDPELRDDLAYAILARWIARPNILQPPELQALADQWRGNLKSGIGESGTNSVLKRSFSALCLSSIAEREAKTPFLGEQRYHQLLADALTYLQTERDLRGYDAKLGWIHATAHTADLLQALAASPLLSKAEQGGILSALATRLSSAPEVYTQGEQDRMAAAILAVIRRSDYDTASFEGGLTKLQDEDKKVWANPLTPETLARYQNHTYFLRALAVRISLDPETPRILDYKQRVLGILRTR
jgi:hypothetical protein